jgi:CRISPR-associated endonuclease/helicase Cas3
VTDLAPADLLIQRAGRLWRHDRGERRIDGPVMLVVSPEPVDAPTSDWIKAVLPGTGFVYGDHACFGDRPARCFDAARL